MPLRIGGLASGMDIDSIVKDLMKAERIPLDRLKQEQQTLQWKQDEYRDINKSLYALRDEVFSLRLPSTFDAKTATSGNSSVAEVSANAAAVAGTYEISVSNLAKAAYKTSTVETAAYTTGATLEQQFGFGATAADKTLAFTINGTEFSFDATQDSVYTVVKTINEYKDATGNGLGVTASYDADLKRFFLMSDNTGAGQQIDVKDTVAVNGNTLMGFALHIDKSQIAVGEDAQFTLNGTALSKSSNQFTINAVTFNLKGISNQDAGGNPVPSTVMVSADTEAVFNSIKDFVELYNETMEDINTELQEKRYRDFPPLTESQKEGMSDKEIELWEEKAKSGLLQNDPILNKVVSDLRKGISDIVENIGGSYTNMTEIGITTGSWYELGKLHLDEGKLQKALNDDVQGVKDLFTNDSAVDNEQGIGIKLYDAIINATKRLIDKAGSQTGFTTVDNSYIGKKLSSLDDRIDKWEDRLLDVEDRYWKDFSRMEQAIQQMNAQSAWLAQQFNSGGA